MEKLVKKPEKLIFEFKGFKNMWKKNSTSMFAKPGKSASLFSAAIEIFYDKDYFYVETHLWLFGFQIFELTVGKNK